MIDAVSTLSVQSAALRSQPQNSVSVSNVQASAPSVGDYIGSRIRVDNLLDMAILEFRSGESGDVIRQYPTESQIRAFQRASELDARQAEAAAREARSQQAVVTQTTSAPQSAPVETSGSAPTPAATSPSPVASAPVDAGVSVSASAPAGASYAPSAQPASTQSVEV